METGKFPEIFKIGKITPIHKKYYAQLLNNYRSVSVIPIFGNSLDFVKIIKLHMP